MPNASPWLQRLLSKMARYSVETRYIQGKTNVIADALSRVVYIEPLEGQQGVPLLEVNAITNILPASPAKLDEIRNQTSQDIYQAWPEYPNECPPDLSVENGLILKGHRLLIPSDLRNQIRQIIHRGHLGAEKGQLKDRDCIS